MTLLFNKINFKKLKLKSKMNKWYINIIILNIDIEYIIRIIRINDLKLFFILVRFWQCYISNLSFRNVHYGMIFFSILICICIKDFYLFLIATKFGENVHSLLIVSKMIFWIQRLII